MIKFDGYLPAIVLIILAVTMLFALYGDKFMTAPATNAMYPSEVPTGTAAQGPEGLVAANQALSGGNIGAAPVQTMTGAGSQPPQFVTVAGQQMALDAGGMAMSPPQTAAMTPDMTAPVTANDFAPEVPPNFVPKNMAVDEAHWMGMDVRRLDHEMRVKLRYPAGLRGILVGQVTMESAMSGLLGGDVITQVNNIAVTTLEEFQAASKTVKDLKESSLTVLRKTNVMDTAGRYQMRGMMLALRTDAELGFAQLEGAPMIQPGDPRPHPDRGPCTNCHAIGTGWEVTPDPDLIPMDPPPITQSQADHKLQPHQDRGPCIACHVIKAR